MHRLFLPAIIILMFIACNDDQPGKLEDAFILSLEKNNFELLRHYLPDVAYYKSLGDKMYFKKDDEIEKYIKESNERVKQAWQITFYNVAAKKIDLNKVKIKEVVYYDPFKKDDGSEAMVINYEYKGRTWDDLQFIIGRRNSRTYLLVIPNPTRAFSMTDPDLRATNEAKTWIRTGKPEFRKTVEDISNKIVAAVNANDLNELGQYLIYRGADERKLWRAAINMNDTTDRLLAAQFMQRLKQNLQNCSNYKTGNFITNRESEGLWITWPLDCGDKIVTLHYLSVNGKLLLGDTGVTEKN